MSLIQDVQVGASETPDELGQRKWKQHATERRSHPPSLNSLALNSLRCGRSTCPVGV